MACGVMHTIGAVNFLFDPAQTPHVNGPVGYEASLQASGHFAHVLPSDSVFRFHLQ
jgi:hypothetical protein